MRANPFQNRTGDALIDAADTVGYQIMVKAGAGPEETGLKARLDQTRANWQAATDEIEEKRLMAQLAGLQMRYEIAPDARRTFLK